MCVERDEEGPRDEGHDADAPPEEGLQEHHRVAISEARKTTKHAFLERVRALHPHPTVEVRFDDRDHLADALIAVSYTHLTLPTILRV